MKYQRFCEPQSGMLLRQILASEIFAFDLHLCLSRDSWKGLTKDQLFL